PGAAVDQGAQRRLPPGQGAQRDLAAGDPGGGGRPDPRPGLLRPRRDRRPAEQAARPDLQPGRGPGPQAVAEGADFRPGVEGLKRPNRFQAGHAPRGGGMSVRVSNIRMGLDDPEAALPGRVARVLGLTPDALARWRILRKSLDARDKDRLQFVYTVEVSTPEDEGRLVELAQAA